MAAIHLLYNVTKRGEVHGGAKENSPPKQEAISHLLDHFVLQRMKTAVFK